MGINIRIIAKFLTLCGIALTCTACYAAPGARYRPQYIDSDVNQTVEVVETTGEAAADAAHEEITDTVHEK